MSRNRLIARIRKNADFLAATAELDRLGLEWSLENPTGKGHPKLVIGDLKFAISCTPSSTDKRMVVSHLRRRLAAVGLI